jgi:hypothetical protein
VLAVLIVGTPCNILRERNSIFMQIDRNIIKMQFRLMCNKKSFQLAFLINLIYILLTYLFYAWRQRGYDISTITSPSAIFPLNAGTEFFDIFINLVPFIVVVPFSMSFIEDKSNLILPALQTRSGIKSYYYSKAVACFIGSFLIFLIPLLLSILLNNLTFPQSGITFLGDLYDINFDANIVGSRITKITNWKGIWFPNLFFFNMELYNILYAFIFSVSMGLLGIFAYALSFMIKKQKIMLLLPVYLLLITFNILDQFLENVVPFTCYKVFQYITINDTYGKNPIFLIVFFSVLTILAVILIIRQSHMDQID